MTYKKPVTGDTVDEGTEPNTIQTDIGRLYVLSDAEGSIVCFVLAEEQGVTPRTLAEAQAVAEALSA